MILKTNLCLPNESLVHFFCIRKKICYPYKQKITWINLWIFHFPSLFLKICWRGVVKYMMLSYLLNIVQGWEETIVKQDQPNESQSEMKISLPSMPSLYVTSFLFRACEDIHRVGGHVLDKPILQKFASRLLEKVLTYLAFSFTQSSIRMVLFNLTS